MELKRDRFGVVWYTDRPGGVRVPVDPEQEFGRDWPGHTADEDEG